MEQPRGDLATRALGAPAGAGGGPHRRQRRHQRLREGGRGGRPREVLASFRRAWELIFFWGGLEFFCSILCCVLYCLWDGVPLSCWFKGEAKGQPSFWGRSYFDICPRPAKEAHFHKGEWDLRQPVRCPADNVTATENGRKRNSFANAL